MTRAKQVSGPQFCGAGGAGGSLVERAADVVAEGFFSGLQLELYDLATDPEERTNLAEKQEVVSLFWMFVDPSRRLVGKWLKFRKVKLGECWRCWRRKPPKRLH